MIFSRTVFALTIFVFNSLWWTADIARAQSVSGDCQPYTLKAAVRECAAVGSPLTQLRTGTFIAGSEAVGETLAKAIGLEVATAPVGSSSGGLTWDFDPSTLTGSRRAGTFGPAFSERAVTIGKGKLSAGFNFLHRNYDSIDRLDLGGFDVFRFQGGTLPVRHDGLGTDDDGSTTCLSDGGKGFKRLTHPGPISIE
jgi:hypothetical protein